MFFQNHRFFRHRKSADLTWPLRTAPAGTFAFVHINKTAGTSIGTAIGLPRKQHLTVREIIERVGPARWGNSFRFAFVRNPWSRVVSQYNHRVRTNQTALGERSIPFAEWVARTHGPEKCDFYYDNPKMFQPQAHWLKNEQGEIDVDFIGRFETLRTSFAQVADRLQLAITVPHLNATRPCDYRSYYDDQTAEIIGEWFSEDCQRFGYRFDPDASNSSDTPGVTPRG